MVAAFELYGLRLEGDWSTVLGTPACPEPSTMNLLSEVHFLYAANAALGAGHFRISSTGQVVSLA